MTEHMFQPYHLVDQSPWPIGSSSGAFLLVSGFIKWFHCFSLDLFWVSFMVILICMAQWWRDVVREGTYQGLHTFKVQKGLQFGMILFIVSEVCFFFSFFWAFFHSSLSPCVESLGSWPPASIIVLNPFQVPLLNTTVLLTSGVSVTWSHESMLVSDHFNVCNGLIITVGLGLYFTYLQLIEYNEASFTIADSVYGSIFFVATGFHGLHVIIGTLFLLTVLVRLLCFHFSADHHFGFEAAIWYWHFVDVVWLFLYVFIYWWGS